MNIQEWLENTADREPTDRSGDTNIPDQFRNDPHLPDQAGRGYRYKRKRASSDSSIIAPKPSYPRNAEVPTRAPPPDHVRKAEDAARELRRRNRPSASSSSRHEAPVKTYEKKPRRKTRLDRYEPKVKKHKRERDTAKAKQSGRKRRRSHRVDDGGRTAGLVQSFQLKNGPKNNRLTLKPDKSAGLFKHGRASVQMAGRGGGLPDLTFNEMRFLQKPTEHQEDLQGADETRVSRTKNPKPDQGDEISAYFNAKAALVTEQDETRNDRRKQQPKGDEPHARSRPSKQPEHGKPLVELPERPFLGFGSKGERPLSKGADNENTSYYTWSETGQQPLSPPSRHQIETHTSKLEMNPRPGRNNSVRSLRSEHETAHLETGVAWPGQIFNKDSAHGTWIRTGRSRGPALVEVYQNPNPLKPKRRDKTPPIQTTSQSLPRHPSSPPQFNEHKTNNPVAEPQDQRSYHTSDILKLYSGLMGDAYTAPQSLLTLHTDQDKENRNPESSLSIDRAIRKATAAVQTQHFIPPPPIHAENPKVASLPNIRRVPSIRDMQKIRQVEPADAVRKPDMLPLQHHYSRPFQARLHSPLHYRPLSGIERQHWETAARETLPSRTLPIKYVRAPAYVDEDEDEEMLDNAADGEPWNVVNNNEWVNSRYEDSVSLDRRCTPRSSIFEATVNVPASRPSGSVFSEQEFLGVEPVRGLSIENEIHSKRPVDHKVDSIDEGLVGFWKPNRLY